MSQSQQLINSGIAAAESTEEPAQTHNVGVISKVGEVATISQPTAGPPRQNMPHNEIADFLCRFTRIHSLEYLTTASQGDIITFTPISNFFSNPSVERKTSQYAYIRFDMEMRFVTAVPAGAYGAYAISVKMNGGNKDYGLPWQNALQVKQSAIIDLSASSDIVMRIPFIYYYDYMRLDNIIDMFEIQATCLAPLTKTFGDATVVGNTQVFARLVENYEMVVPYHQSGNARNLEWVPPVITPVLQSGFDDAVDTVNSAAESYLGGKLSSITETASEIATTIGNSVPVLKPLTEPVSMVTSTASRILSWFGLTRTSDQQTPSVVTWRNWSNVANVDVNDTSEVSALFASNAIAMDPVTSGDTSEVDECAFEYLVARPVLISTFQWSMANLRDHVLHTIPVSPFYTDFGSKDGEWILPTAGYIGLPFSQWRGDMVYDVYIPRSSFHRGTLQVVWVPEDPGGFNLTNITLNAILDIGDYAKFELRVGFARELPVLNNTLISPNYPEIVPYRNSCNGVLQFIVQNPIVAAQAGSDVTVLVYARASENMQFMHLRDSIEWRDGLIIEDPPPTPHPLRSTIETVLQSGAVGDGTADTMAVDLVASSGSYPLSEILAGEDIKSVRPLLQKPCWIPFQGSNELTEEDFPSGLEAVSMQVPHFPPVPRSTGYMQNNRLSPFSHAGYYAAMYVGIAGSTRYKLMGTQTTGGEAWLAQVFAAPRGVEMPYTYQGFGALSFLAPLQQITWQGAEFTVPYYGTRKYYDPRTATDSEQPLDAIVVGARAMSATLGITFQFFQSCAPDTRVNYFRWTPPIVIHEVATTFRWPVDSTIIL